jgi:hypothetical protein
MNKLIRRCLLSQILLLGLLVLSACWDDSGSENKPLPYDIIAIAVDPVDPDVVYLGTGDVATGDLATLGDGVYKSTDGGITWRRIVAGLLDLRVQALAVDLFDPATVYAGTEGGIYRSFNGGEIWEWISGSGSGITAIVIDRNSCINKGLTCRTLYAASESEGVFKSTDGGLSWGIMNSGLTETTVKSLAISPPLYLSGTFPEQCPDPPDPCDDIRDIAPLYPITSLYAGTEEGHVFRYNSVGQKWVEDIPALSDEVTNEILSIGVNPVVPTILYAGLRFENGKGGVYQSLGPGAGWKSPSNITAFCQPLDSVHVLDFSLDSDEDHDNLNTYLGSRGLCRSIDEEPYEPINEGLDKTVLSFAVNPLNTDIMYAGSFNSRFFKSLDGGQSWIQIFIEIQ